MLCQNSDCRGYAKRLHGALGTKEAVAIVPYVKDVIESFDGNVYFTIDTHFENCMQTQEGANLPVPHCIKGTDGWQIKIIND